jgi:hypothetical protein
MRMPKLPLTTLPDLTKLIQARVVLEQLQRHLQTPEGSKRVPNGTKPLDDGLLFLSSVIDQYKAAKMVAVKP